MNISVEDKTESMGSIKKGALQKTDNEWVVSYQVINSFRTLPLHPKYEKYYFLDDEAHGSTVEFEIVNEFIDNHTNQIQAYAKLLKPKEHAVKKD